MTRKVLSLDNEVKDLKRLKIIKEILEDLKNKVSELEKENILRKKKLMELKILIIITLKKQVHPLKTTNWRKLKLQVICCNVSIHVRKNFFKAHAFKT